MRTSRMFGLGLYLAVAAGWSPAPAASFDFLFSVSHVDDDNQYFLNLAVSNYDHDRSSLEPALTELRYVETDLPVVLFLAQKSGKSIDFVVALRAQGLDWSVVFGRLGVPIDVLFVGIERDPGPPYGNAWGHWKRKREATVLSDAAVAGLVRVQVGHQVSGLPVLELARAEGQGKTVVAVVADKKGRPHAAEKGGKPTKAGQSKGNARGKGK